MIDSGPLPVTSRNGYSAECRSRSSPNARKMLRGTTLQMKAIARFPTVGGRNCGIKRGLARRYERVAGAGDDHSVGQEELL